MGKISDIKQQIKRSDRYSIYVDGTYIFSLGESELLNTGIRINKEYSVEELEQLRQAAILDKAYDRALNLISMRKRSEWEMRDYLKRKDYDEVVIQTILNKLRISDYLDDRAFAEAWVRNRRLLKATSKRRLQQELNQKRISSDIIQEVLEADATDELDVLRNLIMSKRKQSKYQDNLKLMQYLSRQGYGYGDIKTVLDDIT
jgi:regulatory protein